MRAHPPTGALPVIRKLRIYYVPTLRLPFLCAIPAPFHPYPDIVRTGWQRRRFGPRVISGFMGRDWPGSSGNVPDDGGKSWRFYELLDSAVRNLSWHGTRVLSSTSSQEHLWWFLVQRRQREKEEEILSFESLTRCTNNKVAGIIVGMIRLDFMSFDRIKNL